MRGLKNQRLLTSSSHHRRRAINQIAQYDLFAENSKVLVFATLHIAKYYPHVGTSTNAWVAIIW
jgi:hypothetical protein